MALTIAKAGARHSAEDPRNGFLDGVITQHSILRKQVWPYNFSHLCQVTNVLTASALTETSDTLQALSKAGNHSAALI
jgi:hypothetical protein